MCGIAGIVYEDPERRVDERALARMCDAIVHRGPDDRGFWTDGGVGLGHQRLSIIDLSPAGRQPMCNEDGTVWVAYNGEIYNFQELRAELVDAGHRFRSRTDTEVIVHLYEECGPDLVERLDGMFAFAVWDAPARRLVLARDRVGKKPLKYAELPGGLAFASELKAILAAGLVERELELADIDRYLTLGWVPAPGTGFARLRKLPPGHRLLWEDGKLRLDRYWSLDYRRKLDLAPAEAREAVRDEVKRAVARRLMADVPLGAFLSGGIDSSIVVACMAEASDRPVETFSIGFHHEAYDELPYARQVAERYGTSHHEFHVRADDASLLPALAELYEEPYADPSALPSWFLARETRQHVTVALNGDGGDEGFAGYDRYARMLHWRARRWPALPGARPLLALARAAADGRAAALDRALDGALQLSHPELGPGYAWLLRMFSARERERLYTGAMRDAVSRPTESLVADWIDDERAGDHPLDRLCFADVCGYLPGLLMVKMDLASMAHSLEARSPLLDHRVLELAASLPAALRCPSGALKGILKAAFHDALPAGLLDRPKHGFGLPLQEWFRGPWLGLARDVLLAPGARVHAYLDARALEALVREHVAGASRGFQLWTLVMLELWHRRVVEGAR